ncbi:E3 ubiquitin-protein ligase RNFT1-like [Physella acuta]|uniref:E3 ubiquitin-protein ligase RNFT1-like n=1 Tax=Physella acuta TaxID=109671 RepID=UPI0027DCFBE5|nr:E3 ubiquitin-protein ligase RNFT1-like [Physella acuta]XP_059156585.1 E3 ubiquitin-protein ligase RNFT1-like [Physella acuta]
MSGSSGSSSHPQQSTSPTAAGSSSNQSLRWSLQNFPVPVQLQARLPRSPLSVAQELLPNFPTHLSHQRGHEEGQPQQYQLSLQQHIQQQLQQQFQRQLQLNLQGLAESPRAPEMPDPPDTILDLDMPAGDSSGGFSSMSNSGNSSAIRGFNSHLLEAILRGAAAQQRPNSNNNSSPIGLISRAANGNSGATQHHHHHAHSHNYQSTGTMDNNALGNNMSVNGGTGINFGADVGQAGVAGNGGGAVNPGPQQAAELTLLYKWVAESGIFILLLFLHFLYDHRLGLLVFLCLGGTFYYTNMKLVHAIHQSAVREQSRSWLGLLNLMWLCGFLIVNIAILYYVFSAQELWKLLYFQMAPVSDISVWTLLWCVVMTDYIIKFLTVIFKSLLAMFQPCSKNYRQRGKYYLLIESISQLYRQVVTIVPWWYYLNDSNRTSLWFAFITEAVYLGFKSWSVWGAVQFLYSSFQRFQSNTSFGIKPSSNDVLERGNQCPICQDTFNEPVMLPCKHIFCEQCVSIWFDREKTCPMCRAEITTESPMWKDGNTSPHLQWH